MKAFDIIQKRQHVAERVPATMRLRYHLQTGTVTVDSARLDEGGKVDRAALDSPVIRMATSSLSLISDLTRQFAISFITTHHPLLLLSSTAGGYSLSSVIRTPRLMSYDELRACDTTYSPRVSQIYDRSYARSHVRNIVVTH